MKQQKQIETIREQLIEIIREALISHKRCIGMFYKNVGQDYITAKVNEEYDTTPVVAVLSSSCIGICRATVYDIFIDKEGNLIATLEDGDIFEEPLTSFAVESLVNIVNWLYEHEFSDPEPEITDELIQKLQGNSDAMRNVAKILFANILSSEPDTLYPEMLRTLDAYKDGDCDAMLKAFSKMGQEGLLEKIKYETNKPFYEMLNGFGFTDVMGGPADVFLDIAKYYKLSDYIKYYEAIGKECDEDDEWLDDNKIDEMGNKYEEMLELIKKICPEEAKEIENALNDLH